MSHHSGRAPPLLSIEVPSSQARSSSPAFGKISTYSHRLPKTVRSHHTKAGVTKGIEGPHMDSEEEDDVGADLERVAKAQITKPLPARRRTPIHVISFGVQPPSPLKPSRSIEDPVIYRKVPPGSTQGGSLSIQSIKQQRRTASIYSTCSTVSNSDPSLPYLRPISVSLSHANVSQDSLSENSAPPRPLSEISSSTDTSSSRTIRPALPPPASRPVNLPSNLPLYPISLAPVPQRIPPNYSVSSNTSSHSRSLSHSRTPASTQPDETPAAERLKRLYLCPWESKDPQPTDTRAAQHTSIVVRHGGREEHENKVVVREDQRKGSFRERFSIAVDRAGRMKSEKVEQMGEKSDLAPSNEATTVVEVISEDREESSRAGTRKERSLYFVKLGFITLLSLALMIDLVVINVKVFTREDWE
ncbi:hypothetical protein JCM3765_000528 [Sporobolomyces pararoseus]